MALSPLIPPYFFSIVLSCPSVSAPLPHNVYRGSPPLPRNLRFLRRLRLKTIVSLTSAPLQDSVLSWAETEGIECIWHEVGPAGEESLGSGIKESVKPVLQVGARSRLRCQTHMLTGEMRQYRSCLIRQSFRSMSIARTAAPIRRLSSAAYVDCSCGRPKALRRR